MASHNRRSSTNLLSTLSAVYSGDPIGVLRTVIPLGCHTASPSSSTLSGTVPEAFHTLVFPSWNRMPATRNSDSANKSNNTRTRSGWHTMYTSSKNAQICSSGRMASATSSKAPWIPIEKSSGIRGRLARPPLLGSPHASVLYGQTTNNSMVWRKTSG